MKKAISSIFLFFILFSGCNVSPFSPEVHQKIDNEHGKIDEVNTVTDGVMAEIGNVKKKLDVQGSQLRDIQDAIVAVKIGGNENSGTQYLSGDGGLMFGFSLCTIGMLLFYFYKEKKANSILIDEIKKSKDPELHKNIIKSASYTNVEKKIYNMLYK